MVKKSSFSEPSNEENVKIACRQQGLIFSRQVPFFYIKFDKADEVVEVPKTIAEILLKNGAIYKIEDNNKIKVI